MKFEIHQSISETWVFEIEAENPEEALDKFKSHGGECAQLYTQAGRANPKGYIEVHDGDKKWIVNSKGLLKPKKIKK